MRKLRLILKGKPLFATPLNLRPPLASATLPQKSDCAPILVSVRLLPPVEAERLLVSSIILRRLNFDFDQQRSGLTRYSGKE
jgi:hypothetical protein